MSEANVRIIIDKLLKEAGWVLSGDEGKVNVDTETRTEERSGDYTLWTTFFRLLARPKAMPERCVPPLLHIRAYIGA